MVIGNFFGFLLVLSAFVCIVLGMIASFTNKLFGNSSPWPTACILFIGGIFYLSMAVLITFNRGKKKK